MKGGGWAEEERRRADERCREAGDVRSEKGTADQHVGQSFDQSPESKKLQDSQNLFIVQRWGVGNFPASGGSTKMDNLFVDCTLTNAAGEAIPARVRAAPTHDLRQPAPCSSSAGGIHRRQRLTQATLKRRGFPASGR